MKERLHNTQQEKSFEKHYLSLKHNGEYTRENLIFTTYEMIFDPFSS